MDQRRGVPGLTVTTPQAEQERSELGDFLLVARRAMLSLCSYIEARYGNQEPRIIRADRQDGKKRAA